MGNKETKDYIADILKTIASLQNQLVDLETSLEARVTNIETKIAEKDTKIEDLEARVLKLELTRENHEETENSTVPQEAIKKLDCARVKNNILLRNVKLNSNTKDGKETVNQTREIVDEIFSDLNLEEDLNGCFEATRFTSKRNSEKEPIVQIKFWTAEGKRLFFKNLAKKKQTSRNVHVKT